MKVTEYLAIYAACLSSIVFLWNIRRATSRVRIELLFALEEIDGKSVAGISVIIRNPSAQTVHLANVSPLVPSKSGKPNLLEKLQHIVKYRRFPSGLGWVHTNFGCFDIDDGCPLSLEPGRAHRIFLPEEKVKEILEESERKELRAVVQDELWRDKYSKAFFAGSFS